MKRLPKEGIAHMGTTPCLGASQNKMDIWKLSKNQHRKLC